MRSRVQLSRGGLALLSRLGQFDRNRLDSQIAVCAGIGTKGARNDFIPPNGRLMLGLSSGTSQLRDDQGLFRVVNAVERSFPDGY